MWCWLKDTRIGSGLCEWERFAPTLRGGIAFSGAIPRVSSAHRRTSPWAILVFSLRETAMNRTWRLKSGLLRGWGPPRRCLLSCDPGINAVAEHIERQRACADNLIVEGAQVEFVAKCFLCTVA